MRKLQLMKRTLLALAWLLPMVVFADDALVWAVQAPVGTSYLVGVSHHSLESDFRGGLPQNIREALQQSKSVYFESNLIPLNGSGTSIAQQWLSEIPARYPQVKLESLHDEPIDPVSANRRLTQQIASGAIPNPRLPPAYLERLDRELDVLFPSATGHRSASVTAIQNDLSAASDAWLIFQIPTALSAIARARLAKQNPDASPKAGLDSLLLSAARKQHKHIDRLETFPEELQTLSALMNAEGKLEQNLNNLIDESLLPNPDQFFAVSAHAAYTGNIGELERVVAEQQKTSEVFRRILLPSVAIRNQRWLPRVLALIKSDNCPCVFAVGGLHLLGRDGMPTLLNASGVKTSRVTLE